MLREVQLEATDVSVSSGGTLFLVNPTDAIFDLQNLSEKLYQKYEPEMNSEVCMKILSYLCDPMLFELPVEKAKLLQYPNDGKFHIVYTQYRKYCRCKIPHECTCVNYVVYVKFKPFMILLKSNGPRFLS